MAAIFGSPGIGLKPTILKCNHWPTGWVEWRMGDPADNLYWRRYPAVGVHDVETYGSEYDNPRDPGPFPYTQRVCFDCGEVVEDSRRPEIVWQPPEPVHEEDEDPGPCLGCGQPVPAEFLNLDGAEAHPARSGAES